MKIAQVYPHCVIPLPALELYDALAIVNYELGRRLARRADEVITYPRRESGQPAIEQHEGVTYRRISQGLDRALNTLKVLDRLRGQARPYRLSSLYYAPYARRVAQDIRARGCDLVHLHSVSNFIPVIRRANPQAPLVLHVHDHSLAELDPRPIAPRLAQAQLILGCSEFVARALRIRFPHVAERCHAFHNGVDQRFLRIESRPAESHRILFVGRLCPEKGVQVLIEALTRLGSVPSWHLDLVGPVDIAPREFVDPRRSDPLFRGLEQFYGRAGDFHEYLLRLAQAAPGRITFHGRMRNQEVGARYGEAALFVFPSLWHEPFGIPVIEAMAAGLPVIATRGGALPEVVVDGETGILVERGDVGALRAAIERLMADPALRARMGAAGRERVQRLFTWDRAVERLEELYRSVMPSSRVARPRTAGADAEHALPR